MRKKIVCGVFVFLGLLQVSAFALIDNAPAWRGEDGSTYAIWEFENNGYKAGSGYIYWTPADGYNDYGDPIATVYPATGNVWLETLDEQQGVWPLSGQIIAYIPNNPAPNETKLIQIQIVWKDETPADGITPQITVDASYLDECLNFTMTEDLTLRSDLGDGWFYSVYTVALPFNPAEETIYIGGTLYVDELIIDTICIPEPATMLILGLGAILLRKVK